jgi:UDP-glucose 4-epimerase
LAATQVLEWAKEHKVKNIVAASSAAVYGNPAAEKLPLKEEEPYAGLSPYAKSKWDMEGVMEEFSKKHSVPSTALRFFNVYGPRQDPHNPYSGVISLFMQQV